MNALGVGKGKGKGKGKSWWSEGIKGKGKGDGEKGGDKGKGKGKNMIFYGECHHCGLIGHSVNRCPHLGKGFKGSCHNCGIIRHSANQCPKGQSKRGKNVNEVANENDEHHDEGEIGGFDLGGSIDMIERVNENEGKGEWREVQGKRRVNR